MNDRPRDRDIQLNRERQLQEPYPAAARVVDQVVRAKAAESPAPLVPEEAAGGVDGMKTGVPSNYEASLGGEPASLTAFEVKKSPGRL
ncbi:hypothetical protein A6764_02380 [Brevibacillus sp. WF146]|uniref:hypothetical protein n=1 Tax=Brevibacillus sp. WF146 TaxID=319501 RepID=UPI0007ECE26E|nr:hypothetical protein [Brevibacillus sp. WF146]UYZ13846.1 hypothetical protein A6764_02380 [Brevibacillus sp. WF146]